jgi:hypothetical protein
MHFTTAAILAALVCALSSTGGGANAEATKPISRAPRRVLGLLMGVLSMAPAAQARKRHETDVVPAKRNSLSAIVSVVGALRQSNAHRGERELFFLQQPGIEPMSSIGRVGGRHRSRIRREMNSKGFG